MTTHVGRLALCAAAALSMSISGCVDPEEPEVAKTSISTPQRADCPDDPRPCGGEWPASLTGPFELAKVREVSIPSHDGTLLHGWIAFPTTPDGTRLPTVLSSSPYYDSMTGLAVYRDPASPVAASGAGAQGWWDETMPLPLDVDTHSAGFPPIHLIRRGYALAYFSVRGTGDSGGCYTYGGRDEQLDQRVIIDWIAEQPWSNGRVGMVGGSFPSFSTWQAAVEAPEALKAIVTAGDLIDPYTWIHSPQGSRSLLLDAYLPYISTVVSHDGGIIGGDVAAVNRAVCMDWTFALQEAGSLATGDRNAAFWSERTLSARLRDVKAAVLDTSGYLDLAGHYGQDSTLWGSLPSSTPKVQIRGWWGHAHPSSYNAWATRLDFPSGEVEWETYVTQWLDYWLKGLGAKPRTGVVYHQDQDQLWHEADGWSPAPAKKEVHYLTAAGLATAPSGGDITFLSAPNPLDADWLERAAASLAEGTLEEDDAGLNPALCPGLVDAGLSHTFESSAAGSEVLIAGNPFVYLTLSSDQPGGVVTVSLYDLAPTFACSGPHATGARYIASGSADLNFHSTPYLAHPFPIGTPTAVRIDLADVTYALAPGHRLAAIVSNGGPYERSGSGTIANITIHGSGATPAQASHLVLPVAEGTLGGQHPHMLYPPRPFTSAGYHD